MSITLSSIKALNPLIAFEANHHLCSSFLVARSSSHVRIRVSPLPPFFFCLSHLFDVNPLTLSHDPACDFSSRLFFGSLEQKKKRKMPRRGLELTPPPSKYFKANANPQDHGALIQRSISEST